MPSVFPLEIEEMILDILGEDDEGYSALKTCSLVCQAFLPICRKIIYRTIVLNDQDEISSLTTCAFERLLRETPEIADYIRELDYTIQVQSLQTFKLTSPSFQESLKPISRLEFLTLRFRGWSRINWSNVRPALLHLLHLPTITHFMMTNVKDFVVSDLIPCVNLKYLSIGDYTTVAAENTFPATLPEHSVQPNKFVAGNGTSAAIMKLCKARRPDGQPIINFGSLSNLTVDFKDPNEEASQELFRHRHVLTNVHITFWDPRTVRPGLADMLRPSMQTLKHIVMNIHIIASGNDDDPLSGIVSVLEDMRTKNIIETVTIGIFDNVVASCRLLRGNWGRLDEVLTAPGWFSLKRVSLAINIPGFFTSNKNKVALRKLPETQFLRLSSSNSVSFDFEVTEY